jgi:kynurenine--oxoglutarate transaminase/cysteine-S-conjugate beta-lyase/glutamine--phenylpyruvate transaminase
VNAIGKYYSLAFNRTINPLNEVLITVGGYGSLFNALSALIEKDDEVLFPS